MSTNGLNRLETAMGELREILEAQPPEPYTGRPRRPNGYRDTPEYRKWVKDRQEWIGRLLQWETAGLEVPESDRRAEIRFYGETVPGTAFERRPDGCIKHHPAQPYITPEPFPEWAPDHPTPKPKEKIGSFLDRLGHAVTIWYVSRHMDNLLERHGAYMHSQFYRNNKNDLLYQDYVRDRGRSYVGIQRRWLEAVRRIMDPKAIAALSKLAGQPMHCNLRNHNLAVSCLRVIQEAAAANPGAVAWWLRLVNNPEDLAHAYTPKLKAKKNLREFLAPIPGRFHYDEDPETGPMEFAFPRHPGQIIGCARQDYRAQGGDRWKALTVQPAADLADQIRRHDPDGAVWMTGILSAAALPQPPQPEPEPEPMPAPEALMNPLFGPAAGTKALAPARRRPHTPKPPPLQPPPEVKIMLLELWDKLKGIHRTGNRKKPLLTIGRMPRNEATDAPRAAALRQLAVLACRHLAGQPATAANTRERSRLKLQFEDLADYVFAEPEAAVRAATWKGLNKASGRWHRANNLRTMRENLAQQAREQSQVLSGWHSPILELESDDGFRARVITSAQELIEESDRLNHCVGGVMYAQACASGQTRIVHLHPKPGFFDPDAPDGLGTTLELYLYGGRWQPGQIGRAHV